MLHAKLGTLEDTTSAKLTTELSIFLKGKFHIRVITSLENIQLQGGAQNIIYRWKYNRGGATDTAQNSKTKTDRGGGGTAYNQSRLLAGWLSQ